MWSIAGSDSGGGAGIQADLATLVDLGVHPCTVISCITAQNSLGVQARQAVEPDMFAAQLDALEADLPPAAIKIGLLGSLGQVQLLVQRLPGWRARWPGLTVVLDPLTASSSGDSLADVELQDGLKQLLPLVDLVTPNTPELEQLTGHRITSTDSARRAAQALLKATGKGVLAKGGHLEDAARSLDQWISAKACWWYQQPRQNTPHSHGTGCTLSTAIAAFCAQNWPLEDAILLANAYLRRALAQAYPTGQGSGTLARPGWPAVADFAQVRLADDPQELGAFPALKAPIGVYPVVADIDLLEALCAAGATTVQLRLKSGEAAVVKAAIERAVAAGQRHGTQVFINDHWQWAIDAGAFGVHLGQDDVAEADLPAIARAGLRLGLSTHGHAELARALRLRPSYLALGHVFATQTKSMPSQPQGLRRLAMYRRQVGDQCPTLAIGGIKHLHFAEVAATGVEGVALVTAVTEAADPVAAWQQLNQHWQEVGR
ncbi:bifunctional hydroxymethylpyrimidine kinase/phosphomethylpyrimidine kinase [Saccharospirillum sp. MSK14-1]|nr:bifunctional hydroxymethylpyrimidine kinase/phosphomethylpyrimidine kinase [Saccharospirillum sp. MSK14-1]